MMNKQTWLEMGWSTPGLPQQRGRYFKKDSSSPAPTPDPMIGQAAAQNIQLGREALEFQKTQYADSAKRQDNEDALASQITKSAIDSQNLSNQWAQQDRNTQDAYRTKYDGQADQDRAAGLAAQTRLDGYETKDQASAAAQKQKLDALGTASNAAAAAQSNEIAAYKRDNSALSQAYEQSYGKGAEYQSAIGKNQVDRYQQNFAPVEDKVASDAMNWDSAGRQENMAAEAKGDAMDAATRGAQANQRAMMSMGVNPNSGRFAATASADSTAAALAAAGAQNQARNNVRAQGVQLRQQAAQAGQQLLASGQQANNQSLAMVGMAQQARQQGLANGMTLNGMAGQVDQQNLSNNMGLTSAQAQVDQQSLNNSMSLTGQGLAARGIGNTTASLGMSNQGGGYAGLSSGIQAGNAALGASGAANAYDASRAGAMMNGFQTSGSLNIAGGQLANSLYGSQLNAWGQQQQANASSSAGTMGAIGSIAGAGLMVF